MRLLSRHTARRAIGVAVILAGSIGLSGCYAYGDGAEGSGPLAFCGILYACGSDTDPNRGGEQTATGSSSSSSSSSSTSTGSTGGQGATTPN